MCQPDARRSHRIVESADTSLDFLEEVDKRSSSHENVVLARPGSVGVAHLLGKRTYPL
jgi:hypothetical protein